MTFRAFLWQAHRWVGLACALPFLVLALTGLAMLGCHALGLGDTPRLDYPLIGTAQVEPALAAARAMGKAPGMILPGVDPAHGWSLQLGGTQAILFDPRGGDVLAVTGSGVEAWLLMIHNSLALGGAGRIVMLVTAVGVLLISLSGFAILRKRWRAVSKVPRSLRHLHHWAGLVGITFLLMWAITGFVLLTMRGGRGRPALPVHTAPCHPVPIGPILADALRRHPGGQMQAIIPGPPVTIILLTRDAPLWAKSASYVYDGCTGAALPARPAPAIMPMLITAKALHTGLWSRTPTLALYLLAALFPLALAISGPWLWLRRFFSKKAPRS